MFQSQKSLQLWIDNMWQMAMAFHGTADYFIENTFNYPTLAECYRLAALNGYNKVMAPVNKGFGQEPGTSPSKHPQ
jgi:hypothetical protein